MPSFRIWAPEPAALSTKSVAERVTTYVLGTPDGRVRTVSAAIQSGFSFGVFVRLAETLGVPEGSVARVLGLSAGSLARRRKRGRFTAHESDRMWVLLRLYVRALDVHGSEDAAREWLGSPLPALGGRSALEVSTDSAGAERVLGVLGQIQHGVFG